VLAAQKRGGVGGKAAEDNVIRVDDVPYRIGIAGLGAVRAHGAAPVFRSSGLDSARTITGASY
jgi:hypothetical protein